eukprot:14657909-Alexandrium_andersonii.AAC.1
MSYQFRQPASVRDAPEGGRPPRNGGASKPSRDDDFTKQLGAPHRGAPSCPVRSLSPIVRW